MRVSKLAGTASVSVLVLVACAGGSAGSSSAGLLGVGSLDPDRQPPAAPVDGAVLGGTVTVLTYDGVLEDPTRSYYTGPNSVLSGLITRSLTQYVYAPAQGTMVLVPDIATDLGTPNDDFTEWTYTIRDGVRFEDGTEVTAEDVAYGIKRSLDRKAFYGGPTYSNEYFLDGDTYKGPYRSGTDYSGVVVEEDTLTIKMAKPFPDMPYWGSFPAMGPIPEVGSDPATYWRRPVATGPYKVAQHSPELSNDGYVVGGSLTLVRNEEWDPDTDPGRHAYPDRYVFRFGQELKDIDAAILGDSKQGQTTLSWDNMLPADYPKARRLGRVTVGPGNCTQWWLPDYRRITDIRVRQAIGYAFPYAEYADALGWIAGVTTLPASSILPPGIPGRRDFTVLDTEPGSTDLEKARALLKRAGAEGFVLSWAYDTSDPVNVKITELVSQSFDAAGFTADPYPTPSFDDLDTVNRDPEAPINMRSGPVGWCSDWPSGGSWFPLLFKSSRDENLSHFSEPAIDKEIDRISLLPPADQLAAWGALDKTIMTRYYPVVITGHSGQAMLHGSRIGGMKVDNVLGMPTWKDIYVKP